jgi:hypothetical protein
MFKARFWTGATAVDLVAVGHGIGVRAARELAVGREGSLTEQQGGWC